MKLNYKMNKEINKIINEFIKIEKYYFIENDNLYNLLNIHIFNNDYDIKENIINKIENEKKLNYKEITILKKCLKDLIKDILNNDIKTNINLKNEILLNENDLFFYYLYNDIRNINKILNNKLYNECLKEILLRNINKEKYINNINKFNVIKINYNRFNEIEIIENYNFNIDLIENDLFNNYDLKYLNYYIENYY